MQVVEVINHSFAYMIEVHGSSQANSVSHKPENQKLD